MARQWLMLVGAVFFMVSDCIIGINMFYAAVPHHQVTDTLIEILYYVYVMYVLIQVWIMSTYHIAQFLIALSAILGNNGKENKIK